MKSLTNYYKNLCQQLESELNLLEAVMSKAKRVGTKYPHRLTQAEIIQRIKADKSQQENKELRKKSNAAYNLSKRLYYTAPFASGEFLDLAVSRLRKADAIYQQEKAHTKNLSILDNIKQKLQAKMSGDSY